jgi:hypothetical protein
MTKEDELRDKINTFMVKLDKMESRVKDVEVATSAIAKLEAKLEKVEHRMDSTEKAIGIAPPPPEPHPSKPTPPPVKAFVSGVSIGLLVIGVIVAAWLLGFF